MKSTFLEVSSYNPSSAIESSSGEDSGIDKMVGLEDMVHNFNEVDGGPKIPLHGPENVALDLNNMRYAYHASTWSKEHSTLDPNPGKFAGDGPRTNDDYVDMPTFMHLFRKFWPWDPIRKIRDKTNCYAGSVDKNGRPHGRDG